MLLFGVCLACYLHPVAGYFDRFMYETIVLGKSKPIEVVYDIVRHENPRAEASSILDSPQHLREVEPLYAIRPLYLELVRCLTFVLPVGKAIDLVSAGLILCRRHRSNRVDGPATAGGPSDVRVSLAGISPDRRAGRFVCLVPDCRTLADQSLSSNNDRIVAPEFALSYRTSRLPGLRCSLSDGLLIVFFLCQPDKTNLLDPNHFVAEVYRRMSLRHAARKSRPNWEETERDQTVLTAAHQYAPYLPVDKMARILDIGFGSGWFLAACLKLGYQNLFGADFGIQHKDYIRDWASDRIAISEIRSNVGEFLSDKKEQFDFIHMSHVIEHIPKHSLFWVVDSLFWALRRGGTLLLRTPNMEGPCANSSLYVTLAHEYGFAGSNLVSLLDICGFDEVRLLNFQEHSPTFKQRFGSLLRWPFLKEARIRHRLFGVNHGGEFGPELIVIGKRGEWPPYFDPQYR